MNWQPIETAPKDGTRILVCGGTYYCTDDYDDKGYPLNHVRIANWDKHDARWFSGDASAHDVFYIARPTYWQHLPEPPK